MENNTIFPERSNADHANELTTTARLMPTQFKSCPNVLTHFLPAFSGPFSNHALVWVYEIQSKAYTYPAKSNYCV